MTHTHWIVTIAGVPTCLWFHRDFVFLVCVSIVSDTFFLPAFRTPLPAFQLLLVTQSKSKPTLLLAEHPISPAASALSATSQKHTYLSFHKCHHRPRHMSQHRPFSPPMEKESCLFVLFDARSFLFIWYRAGDSMSSCCQNILWSHE